MRLYFFFFIIVSIVAHVDQIDEDQRRCFDAHRLVTTFSLWAPVTSQEHQVERRGAFKHGALSLTQRRTGAFEAIARAGRRPV